MEKRKIILILEEWSASWEGSRQRREQEASAYSNTHEHVDTHVNMHKHRRYTRIKNDMYALKPPHMYSPTLKRHTHKHTLLYKVYMQFKPLAPGKNCIGGPLVLCCCSP